jgi:hypothetical protein
MPQRPLRHDPDAGAVVYVRVRGWAKNACLDAAERAGMTLNAWAAAVLAEAALGHGITPGETTRHNTSHDTTHRNTPHDTTRHDAPSVVDTLLSWATGSPLVAPCGRSWPCVASERTSESAGHHYCSECGVRVSRPGLPPPG